MMKHILIGVALLSLMATSCSKDDVIDNGTKVVTGKTIKVNATINNCADTRLAYNDDGSKISVGWSDSESFTLYKGTATPGSLFTNTSAATGTFTGPAIEGGNEDDKYYAVYGDNITNEGGILSIDITNQTGTADENGIKEFMLATADALTSTTTLTFDYKLTVLKMELTLPSDVTGKVEKLVISGLHNKATYDLSKSTDAYSYTNDDKGVITATNGTNGFEIKETDDGETKKKSFTAYVAVFPESFSSKQITIIATIDDVEYSYTIESETTLQENQVVPVQVTLVHKTNFKSAYTKEDYFLWDACTYVLGDNSGSPYGSNVTAEHSCALCPTASQMVAYLKAGVYWDDSDVTDGQLTYSAIYGTNGESIASDNHAGLWLKKKSKIGEAFYNETETYYYTREHEGVLKKLSTLPESEVKKIRTGGDYFFLPAAGKYDTWGAGSFGGPSGCYYWSSSPCGDDSAYRLEFDPYSTRFSVSVEEGWRNKYGYLPMVAE